MLPTPLPRDLLPTTFLPQLPRPKNTLEPLSSTILLGHIGILRELYIPPIHGGFQATDVGHDSDVQVDRRTKVRARRFSASLTDTMDSLGLGLDLDLEADGEGKAGAAGTSTLIDSAIIEENEGSGSDADGASDAEEIDGTDDDEQAAGHLDPFEREWAEKWLNGVVRRAQSWIEEHEEESEGEELKVLKEMEAILRDSTAVLAMMAGTSAAGSLTRHLLFPIHHSLAPGLKALQTSRPVDPSLSPTTTSFLASLATSPVSPIIPFRPSHAYSKSSDDNGRYSPESSTRQRAPSSPTATRRRKRAAVPILLHDAPMQDHVSVGVQTWGSAILLGREMSLNPSAFGLFPGPSTPAHRGVRVLELGAGTGLLGILCRKLLDLRMASSEIQGDKYPGIVVATDYHHDVLANLKVCVDLNFPPRVPTATGGVVATKQDQEDDGVKIAKLDWTTFPEYMAGRVVGESVNEEGNADVGQYVGESFDLVLASDCVYDPTHAKLLRDVAGWVLRLPDESIAGDIGGTMHLLSPVRPTFTPELESIDVNFPTLASYRPLTEREAAARQAGSPSDIDNELRGEGLGRALGLKLGVRGEGKRSVKGRKGEGRVDEVAGYWWWEVGWG